MERLTRTQVAELLLLSARERGGWSIFGGSNNGKTAISEAIVSEALKMERQTIAEGVSTVVCEGFIDGWLHPNLLDGAITAGLVTQTEIDDIIRQLWAAIGYDSSEDLSCVLADAASQDGLASIHPFFWRLATNAYQKNEDKSKQLSAITPTAVRNEGIISTVTNVKSSGSSFTLEEGLGFSVETTKLAVRVMQDELGQPAFHVVAHEYHTTPQVSENSADGTYDSTAVMIGFGHRISRKFPVKGTLTRQELDAFVGSVTATASEATVSVLSEDEVMVASASSDELAAIFGNIVGLGSLKRDKLQLFKLASGSFVFDPVSGLVLGYTDEEVSVTDPFNISTVEEAHYFARGLSNLRNGTPRDHQLLSNHAARAAMELDVNKLGGSEFNEAINFASTLAPNELHRLIVDSGLYRYFVARHNSARYDVCDLAAAWAEKLGQTGKPFLACTELKNLSGYGSVAYNADIEKPYVELKVFTSVGCIHADIPCSLVRLLLGANLMYGVTHFSVLNLTALHKVSVPTSTHKGGLPSVIMNTTQLVSDHAFKTGKLALIEQRDDFSPVSSETAMDPSPETEHVRSLLSANSRFALNIARGSDERSRSLWFRAKHYGEHKDGSYLAREVRLEDYPEASVFNGNELEEWLTLSTT